MKDIILHMQKTLVIPASLAIWGLGQMGVVIKGSDGIIYIDACLSDVVESKAGPRWARAYPPPVPPEQVTK